MLLTNEQIYSYANKLVEAFGDSEQRLPVKMNFYLQKNKKILLELAQDIEKSRLDIAQSNGTYDSERGQYAIDPNKIENAQKELIELFEIEQEVDIQTISFDSIDENLVLTTAQMEALMFMID